MKPFILTFYPVSVPNYLQKTSKFRFASKKKNPGKTFDFQILLFTFKSITVGMKTVYLNSFKFSYFCQKDIAIPKGFTNH